MRLASAETAVVALVRARAARGYDKYGVTTDRKDLARVEWLRHAQEEALDLAVYLQKLLDIEEGWRPMDEAPKNATWVFVRLPDGAEVAAHWASDLSGEEQPPFEGWFVGGKHTSGFRQVKDPVLWRPLSEQEAEEAKEG